MRKHPTFRSGWLCLEDSTTESFDDSMSGQQLVSGPATLPIALAHCGACWPGSRRPHTASA